MESSLFYLLFLLSLFHIITCEGHSCLHDQSSALLHFKHSFSITCSASDCADTYPKVESWKPNTDCCFWDGVTCDIATGQVIGLDLTCSCLNGSIHSNSSLFQLRHLQTLNLAYNNFNNSQISSEFYHLTSLTHLNVSYSGFSGQITSEISGLSKLISLDLSYNERVKISLGKLVQSLANLRELVLDGMNISSVVPDFLGNLSSLTYLSLYDCSLFGEFPTSIFQLPNLELLLVGGNLDLTGHFPEIYSSSSLWYLDLSETNFFGKLPDSIGNLKLLNHLILSDCNFSGSLPFSLWNLTQLITLDLSNNEFNGQISSSLSNLTHISYLDLASNQLTGLPSYVSQLSNLTILNLNRNSLSGAIPASLFTQPSLRKLDLSENKLTGPLDEFQSISLIPLVEIFLKGNELHGPIPRSFSKLMNLRTLDLSSNNLSGTIELDMLFMLKNLDYLDLSDNNLSLIITTVHLNSTFLKLGGLDFSSNMISQFPDFLTNQNKLKHLDLSNNKIHGQIPKWMWKVGKETMFYMNLSHNFLEGLEEPPAILPWGRGRLKFLDLHSNQLQGPLPIPPLSTAYFSISNNKLTGEIPPLICNVSSLEILDLSNNDLSGLIPQCMGDFSKAISVLNLRRNSFHGTIPSTLTNGSSLRTLDLSNNQLKGRVPRSLVNCKKLEVLNLGNNQLNDTFPIWLETLPKLQVLTLRSNKFYGTIDQRHLANYAFSKLRIIDLSYNEFMGDLPSTYFLGWSAMMMSYEKEPELRYMGGDRVLSRLGDSDE
ncbi:hypothetical protein HHK36_002243 [Tetracentron sinense]|uniref:Leucine-rich repeat-containing N-terminal plant-type domain-containing protein n=1 Tax=Tetracentron sinense TaxID=13715 RepID=A0A835DST1_TETSI|nr:hypothetical protein HHK36_002243 [Tetracentron sinense]